MFERLGYYDDEVSEDAIIINIKNKIDIEQNKINSVNDFV